MKIEEIRAKLKSMESGRPRNSKWKPKDKHTVRLLPLPDAEDLAFVVKWHYGVDGNRPLACPTTWGDDCIFCEFGKTLRSWKNEKGVDKTEGERKRDWELFKKVEAAVKHYAPVVVRKPDSAEVEGPFLWEMTPKSYKALLSICAHDDWNEDHPEGGVLKILTSLKHGLDVDVELKKKGEKGNTTNFDLTEIGERKKFSWLVKNDLAASEALVAKQPVMADIAKPVSAEEAEKVFNTWSASMQTEAPSASEGVEHATNGAEHPASGGASVDETVARLEALLGPSAK